jgi:hypothetical protein
MAGVVRRQPPTRRRSLSGYGGFSPSRSMIPDWVLAGFEG